MWLFALAISLVLAMVLSAIALSQLSEISYFEQGYTDSFECVSLLNRFVVPSYCISFLLLFLLALSRSWYLTLLQGIVCVLYAYRTMKNSMMFDGNRILKPSEMKMYKVELYCKAIASAALVFLILYRLIGYGAGYMMVSLLPTLSMPRIS